MGPIKGLEDQWHGVGSATSKNNRIDGYPLWVLPSGVDVRALLGWSGEAGVGVRGKSSASWRPVLAGPIDQVIRSTGESFPPNASLIGQCDVGEDGVFRECVHGTWVGLPRGPWSDSKETGLWVDRMQFAGLARPQPSDVIAHEGRFPAGLLVLIWGNDHGQVGFSAGAWECGRQVGLHTIGALESHDEHVFGHPAMIPSDGAGDAQRDAFLSQQRVASVARSIRPNFSGFWKMNDVFIIVAWPWDIGLALGKGSSDAVKAWDKATMGSEFGKDFLSHVAHDLHAHDDIGRVGQFDPYKCQRAIDRSHAKRDHVHGSSSHRTCEFFFQLRPHLFRMLPVVGGPCIGLSERADKGAVFDTCGVRRMASRQKTVRMKLGVEPDKRFGVHQLFGQLIPFSIVAVAQDDAIGLAHGRHLANPLVQRRIGTIKRERF